VTRAPAGLPAATVGQLEDCATGIYEMDAAIGKLCAYLESRERPAIVVFWGDHMNPMSDGYKLFEETGYIEKGDSSAPQLRTTPLLIWSNFADNNVELGTLATYNISPVMMDLFGLEKPLMFKYLTQQLTVLRGRTNAVTIEPDNTFSFEMTGEQRAWFNKHSILQYDYMFGERLLEDYIPDGEAGVIAGRKEAGTGDEY
jgi:phosphoglycerol transferase MdoB-like AlkP superfamily enzyme